MKMKKVRVVILSLLAFILSTSCFKFAIINDIHMNLNYTGLCNLGRCNDMGNYGSDPPFSLFNTIVDDIHTNYEDENKIDAIIVNGDFNSHGLSVKQRGDANIPHKFPQIL